MARVDGTLDPEEVILIEGLNDLPESGASQGLAKVGGEIINRDFGGGGGPVLGYNEDVGVIVYAGGTIAPDTTQVRVGAGNGTIGSIAVSWIQTDITALNIATQSQGYVYVDNTGTLQQQNTPLTPLQRRTNIYLSRWATPNNTNLSVVVNESMNATQKGGDIQDLFRAIGTINNGIKFIPDGANLSMQRIAGTITSAGTNITNADKNTVQIAAANPVTFGTATQLSPSGNAVTVIDPTNYDLNGVVTAIPGSNNRAQNMRIIQYASGNTLVYYGQEWYATLDDAKAAISTESPVISNIEASGIKIATLSVIKGAGDLNITTDGVFTAASKFGESTGGGGGTPGGADNSVTSVAGTPTGGDRISTLISLTTAEYTAATKVADTLYILTDA